MVLSYQGQTGRRIVYRKTKTWGRRVAQAALVSAVSSIGIASFAQGQVSGSWLNPNGGTWTVGPNWDSNPLYPDGGGTAVFGPGNGATATITLNTGISLGSIRFDSIASYDCRYGQYFADRTGHDLRHGSKLCSSARDRCVIGGK